MKLVIGAGLKRFDGSIHLDKEIKVNPDIIADCEKILPFKSGVFSHITAENIIEHINSPDVLLKELYRIMKHSALLSISVPHFSSDDTYADITHKRGYSIRSFDDFIDGYARFSYYSDIKFKLVHRKICFGRLKKLLLIEYFANKFPLFYETHLAFIFQAHHIDILLKK